MVSSDISGEKCYKKARKQQVTTEYSHREDKFESVDKSEPTVETVQQRLDALVTAEAAQPTEGAPETIADTTHAFGKLGLLVIKRVKDSSSPAGSSPKDHPGSPKKRKAASSIGKGSILQDEKVKRNNDIQGDISHARGALGQLLSEFDKLELNTDLLNAIKRTESRNDGGAENGGISARVDRTTFELAVSRCIDLVTTQISNLESACSSTVPKLLRAYAMQAIATFSSEEALSSSQPDFSGSLSQQATVPGDEADSKYPSGTASQSLEIDSNNNSINADALSPVALAGNIGTPTHSDAGRLQKTREDEEAQNTSLGEGEQVRAGALTPQQQEDQAGDKCESLSGAVNALTAPMSPALDDDGVERVLVAATNNAPERDAKRKMSFSEVCGSISIQYSGESGRQSHAITSGGSDSQGQPAKKVGKIADHTQPQHQQQTNNHRRIGPPSAKRRPGPRPESEPRLLLGTGEDNKIPAEQQRSDDNSVGKLGSINLKALETAAVTVIDDSNGGDGEWDGEKVASHEGGTAKPSPLKSRASSSVQDRGGRNDNDNSVWGSSLVCADLTVDDVASKYWPFLRTAVQEEGCMLSLDEEQTVDNLVEELNGTIVFVFKSTPSGRQPAPGVKSLIAATVFDDILRDRCSLSSPSLTIAE